jgi:cytochrome c peroxidase
VSTAVARKTAAARIRRSTLAILALVAVRSAAPAVAETACDFVKFDGASCTPAAPPAPCQVPLPQGFPCPVVPADNPLTLEKIELGRFLFYDTRMSGNQTYACASCHKQALAFTDGLAHAVGSTGQVHPRSAMTLANAAYVSTLGWANPLLDTLEKQVLVPITNEHPIELGLSGKEDELIARLRADARYQRMFAEAYGKAPDPFTLGNVVRSIASFERTLISGNSPHDRYVFGDDNAISASAIRGEVLFYDETHECFHCHAGFNFVTSVDAAGKVQERSFENTGLYNLRCSDFGLPALDLVPCISPPTAQQCMRNDSTQPPGCYCDGAGPQDMGCYPPDNTGAAEVTTKTDDMGKFKAPTLRNIAVTAPYMHDGSATTLDDVLDHYAAGGRTITDGPYAGVGSQSPAKGQFVRGFALSDDQRQDLLAFLRSLTDDTFLTNPKFGDPFQPVACPGDCNLDGYVEVNELVTALGTSLGTATLAQCVAGDPSGNGVVTVDELVRAIRSALTGCP